jgi:hypothetical protein
MACHYAAAALSRMRVMAAFHADGESEFVAFD